MTRIQLKNVRLAFPALFEPKTFNGEGKPAFSASLIIDSADPQLATLSIALEKCASEKWGQKAPVILKQLKTADKLALHDGERKPEYDGFAGAFYLSARNAVRPLLINRDKTPITEADGILYAGCYVNASVELWAQDNNYGKRINATLCGIQFCRDGDAFAGGGAADADEFDDLSISEETEEMADLL